MTLRPIGVVFRRSCFPVTDDQVEFVMEKPKGAKFDVGGVLYDKVRLTMVLDGYTAPVTAGTIVDLIQRGERESRPTVV